MGQMAEHAVREGLGLERALMLFARHRHREAAEEAGRHLAGNPEDARGHALLSLCLDALGKRTAAMKEARAAVGADPELGLGHYTLAVLLGRRLKLDEAEEAAGRAVAMEPDNADFLALRAELRGWQGDWTGALGWTASGLAAEPDHLGCINERSKALLKLGRLEEAKQMLARALEIDPQDAATHANQGWVMLHKGWHAAALEHFGESLRLDPNSRHAREGLVESLNARHALYRVPMKFFLWASRLSENGVAGLVAAGLMWPVVCAVIGGMLGRKEETWMLLTALALPLLLLLVVLSKPVFNLLLRMSDTRGHALNWHQRLGVNLLIIGATWATATGIAVALHAPGRIMGPLMGLVPLLPGVAIAITMPSYWRRMMVWAFVIVTGTVGAMGMTPALLSGKESDLGAMWLVAYVILGFLAMIFTAIGIAPEE